MHDEILLPKVSHLDKPTTEEEYAVPGGSNRGVNNNTSHQSDPAPLLSSM